jgi:hypothetical protein
VSALVVVADCPECRSAGAVSGGRCEICDARVDGAADLPPAAPPASPSPLGEVRLTDVLRELQLIAVTIRDAGGSKELIAACTRAEQLVVALEEQFLADVVFGRPAASRTGR